VASTTIGGGMMGMVYTVESRVVACITISMNVEWWTHMMVWMRRLLLVNSVAEGLIWDGQHWCFHGGR